MCVLLNEQLGALKFLLKKLISIDILEKPCFNSRFKRKYSL
jgi:hypothetical protein